MSNTNKIVKFDLAAREDLLKGVNILTDSVKTTMGPRGRNVVIESPGTHPILTKDGVTVAQAVNLSDPFLNLGVQMIKEAASRTADTAGDGTTAATLLSQVIFAEGLKMLAAGYSSSDIKYQIKDSVDSVLSFLRNLSIPITKDDEIKQIATISANGEVQVGDLIFEAIKSVGVEGVVTVEEAKGFQSSLTVVEGMRIDRGYLSPYFVTNQEKMTAELENPYILICNKKIDNMKEIMPLLERTLNEQKSLLIIADDMEGDAMQGLVVNKMRGTLKACAIKAPGFGESRLDMLNDLAVVLGGEVVSSASGDALENLDFEKLGTCKKILIGRTATVFIDGGGESQSIEKRADSIREYLNDSSIDLDQVPIFKERLAKLAGGVAILKVGGATEAELRERKDRVDDALSATLAAIEEGILPGGGVALAKASQTLESHNNGEINIGAQIIKNACFAPMKQIILNAGGSPDIVLQKILEHDENFGYDAYNEKFGDMFEMGIIDPLKVIRSALENAASAASMMLTVGCAMIEENRENDTF